MPGRGVAVKPAAEPDWRDGRLFSLQIRPAALHHRSGKHPFVITQDGEIRWAAVDDDVTPVGSVVFVWLRSLRYIAIPQRSIGADRTALVAFVRLYKGGGTPRPPVFARPVAG